MSRGRPRHASSVPSVHVRLGDAFRHDGGLVGLAGSLLRSQRFWLVALLITVSTRVFTSVTHAAGGLNRVEAVKDVDVYGPGMEDLTDVSSDASSDAVHPILTSGSRLVDYVSLGENHGRRQNRGPPTDVGVRPSVGVLPRGNHRAWVSRISAEQRPSQRYKHMATVARVGTRYVVAWQGSAVYEGHSDQRIYHTFSRDAQGTAWGPEHTIPAIERGTPQWSPVLHVDEPGGRIILFYSESALCIRPPPGPDEGNPQGIFGPRHLPGGDIKMTVMKIGEPGPDLFKDYSWLRSVRWEPPKTILAQGKPGVGFGPVPKVIANPMIVLSTGEWLLPYWREPHDAAPCEKNHTGSSGVLRSRDGGKTWRAHGQLQNQRTWLIENTLVERSDGAVLMLFRTKVGILYKSVSYDKGKTWADAVPTSIPNPDSKIHMLRLLSGHLALVLNSHAKLKVNRKARTYLDVAISADEGLTWNRIARLEDDFTPGVRSHYPTAVADETRIAVVYSKFYFGPHLETALANNTAMGVRMKMVDTTRLPMLEHADPSQITASDTGGAAALLTSGINSVMSAVISAGEVGEVGEDSELDEGMGGRTAATSSEVHSGGGRHSSRRSGGGHGHGGNSGGGTPEEVQAFIRARQQQSGGAGLPPKDPQFQPLVIDDLQTARAKFEALQRESERLKFEHRAMVEPRVTTGEGRSRSGHDPRPAHP